MKKDYSNYTIQIYLEPSPIKFRQIFWRINPKELNWWERNFKNPWRRLYHQCMYHMNPYFSTEQYKKYDIKNLKTYADVINYINNEEKKAQDEHDDYVANGIIWDDEPIYN